MTLNDDNLGCFTSSSSHHTLLSFPKYSTLFLSSIQIDACVSIGDLTSGKLRKPSSQWFWLSNNCPSTSLADLPDFFSPRSVRGGSRLIHLSQITCASETHLHLPVEDVIWNVKNRTVWRHADLPFENAFVYVMTRHINNRFHGNRAVSLARDVLMWRDDLIFPTFLDTSKYWHVKV